MTISLQWPLTVYYDASCPLCRAEMEAMKARDAGDVLRLVDCSTAAFDAGVGAGGITQEMMMSRIHARDAAGRWLVGVDVFVAVYRAAGLRMLAGVYAGRRLRPLFDRLYPWIADHRYVLTWLGLPRLFRLLASRATPPPRSCTACAKASESAQRR